MLSYNFAVICSEPVILNSGLLFLTYDPILNKRLVNVCTCTIIVRLRYIHYCLLLLNNWSLTALDKGFAKNHAKIMRKRALLKIKAKRKLFLLFRHTV